MPDAPYGRDGEGEPEDERPMRRPEDADDRQGADVEEAAGLAEASDEDDEADADAASQDEEPDAATQDEDADAASQDEEPDAAAAGAGRGRRRGALAAVAAALVLALVGVVALAVPLREDPPRMEVDGPADGTLLGADDVDAAVWRITLERAEDVEDLELRVDEEDALDRADVDGAEVALELSGLEDGEHELSARLGRQEDARTVAIDTEPPDLELEELAGPIVGDDAIEVTGTVDDPDAEVTAEGGEVTHSGEELTVTVDEPGEVTVTAVDAAGNAAVAELGEVAWVPSRVEAGPVRSVHVSFWAWATADLRDPVLELAEDGLINSVQLDLKDEAGIVGYDSEVERAHEIGAVQDIYDLEEAVAELHERGVNVIGRIVAFRDPILASHAWDADERDQVIQDAEGEPYGGYGGFSNFAHEAVVDYNIAVAEEAARAGVDDILWDYVRRPDGAVENFAFPGLEGSPEDAVNAFVAEADDRLEPYGVAHGASVYGIAVDRPTEIAQDLEVMADHVDYLAPMLYPSHWGPGEYDVDDPINEPYAIVHASMLDFVELAEDRRARIVPWLQDFSMAGVSYGEDEVRDQIEATHDAGVDEWILWDPVVNYTRDALSPIE